MFLCWGDFFSNLLIKNWWFLRIIFINFQPYLDLGTSKVVYDDIILPPIKLCKLVALWFTWFMFWIMQFMFWYFAQNQIKLHVLQVIFDIQTHNHKGVVIGWFLSFKGTFQFHFLTFCKELVTFLVFELRGTFSFRFLKIFQVRPV